MATLSRGFHRTDPASSPAKEHPLPPWLTGSTASPATRPPSPSVTLSLASSAVAPASPPIPWMQAQQPEGGALAAANQAAAGGSGEMSAAVWELVECCREVEEGQRAWAAQKKEAGWRVRRVEAQMESEKACRRRGKAEEVEAKVKALREEQQAALERMEAEYREQLAGLRRDAEAKDQKLADQWAAKHTRLANFLQQMEFRPPRFAEPNGR